MILAFPSLNDIEPSWADIIVTATVSGGILVGIEAIAALKWSRKVEVGERRGASGGRVMARTTGQSSFEASGTFYRSGVRSLEKALMAVAPRRGLQAIISLVSFDIMVQHTPPGEIEIYQTLIKGCRYLGDSDDMKEGSDADKVELTLNPMEIVKLDNGQEIAIL